MTGGGQPSIIGRMNQALVPLTARELDDFSIRAAAYRRAGIMTKKIRQYDTAALGNQRFWRSVFGRDRYVS